MDRMFEEVISFVFINRFHESYISMAYMQSDCVWLLCEHTDSVQGSLQCSAHSLFIFQACLLVLMTY